ncbi:hypothetical protein BR63_15040 [Thermanaerosceptrum fracticalcis]|uniref:Uncharacterized protein n=1 Tax=Thermanaerosceptrum fracticalcis TaxID=1712410 RepID=A0A7G6E5X8_THEFR|nr:hypothetical protein [Thermanaerosceptrum fracticalcis]QNB47482.1 hypothetical protein BR63_15040 [Thermanaerosceptrum fracticalcis]
MKRFEINRNEKIEEYVFITQVLFYFLMGILVIRVFHIPYDTPLLWNGNGLLLLFAFLGVIFIKAMQREKNIASKKIDYLVNAIYLIMGCYLLIHERETFFKILLVSSYAVSG